MFYSVLRQRRRIAFAFLMTQLAGLRIWPDAVLLAMLTLAALVISIAIIAFAPRARRWVEAGAIGLYIGTLMPIQFIMPTALCAAIIVYALLYSPFLDRVPLRIGLRSKKAFLAPFDLRTTWAKIIPGQGHPIAYWTGTLQDVARDEDDDSTLYLTFQEDNGAREDVTVTFLLHMPFTRATFLLERDTQVVGEEVMMTYHVTKTTDEKTTIWSDMHVSGLPIRVALARFFDDVLGDELDRFAKMTDCRRKWLYRNAADADVTSAIGRNHVPLELKQAQQEKVRLSA